jgi:hypothetical protein
MDGFVARGEDEAFGAELEGGAGQGFGREDVVPRSLDGVRLGERQVLVAGDVEHHRRAVLVEDEPRRGRVGNVGDDRDTPWNVEVLGDGLLSPREPLLRAVDENQALRPEPRNPKREL